MDDELDGWLKIDFRSAVAHAEDPFDYLEKTLASMRACVAAGGDPKALDKAREKLAEGEEFLAYMLRNRRTTAPRFAAPATHPSEQEQVALDRMWDQLDARMDRDGSDE